MIWKELVKVALIGTDKSQLSAELIAALKKQGIDTNLESSKLILEAAALYAQMNKAGFQLDEWKEEIPAEIKVDTKLQVCSHQSTQHLYLILEGSYEKALPEFILHMKEEQKILAPELLPDLFDKCKTDKSLVEHLIPIIGTRGKWLITQNPDWHFIHTNPKLEEWETARKTERLQLLKRLRKTQAEQAIELLEATWTEEDYTTKLAFLKLLGEGLNIKDEAFLESCLNDRRKEVRLAAAQLLSSLADSKLIERMFERVCSLIVVKKRLLKKEKLEINLPEEIDEAMLRDGIDAKSNYFSGGLKANRLGQMMAVIPPKKWESYFKQSPGSVLNIFIRSDWSELLVQAAIMASARHRDEQWMEILVLFWSENYDKQRWQKINIDPILEVLPSNLFHKTTLNCIKNTKNLLEENAPAIKLLNSNHHPWEDKLTVAVIQNFQHWMSSDNAKYWSAWHFKNILAKAAYLANPKLHDSLSNSWPENSRVWGTWENEITTFLTTLRFRKKMIESLKS